MPLGVFEKIIEKLDTTSRIFNAYGRPRLFLHGYGEPTLVKHLPEMLVKASESKRFSDILFVSNFNVVSHDKYDVYFRCGLTKLYCSLDTLDPKKISATRVGTDIDRLHRTLRSVAAKHGEKMLVITVLSEQNMEELPSLYDFIRNSGVSTWNIQLMNKFDGEFAVNQKTIDRLAATLPNNSDFKVNFEGFPYPSCTQPFDTLVINVEGSVAACCTYFTSDVISFGNVLESDVTDIFESEKFRMFREEFAKGRPDICKDCPYY